MVTPRRISDEQTYSRFARGRNDADFAELYRRLAPRVLAYARQTTGSMDEAEELSQVLWTTIVAAPPQFDPERRLNPWLRGTLRNLWYMELRRRGCTVPTEARNREESTPLNRAVSAEIAKAVHEGVRRLPPHYREVVELGLLNGLSSEQIATRLKRPKSTIATQMQRALTRLRQSLSSVVGVLLCTIALPGSAHATKRRSARSTLASSLLLIVTLFVGAGTILVGAIAAGDPMASPPESTPDSKASAATAESLDASNRQLDSAPAHRISTTVHRPRVEHTMRMLDRAMQPVAGITVRLIDSDHWPPAPFEACWTASGLTDAKGVIRFANVARGLVKALFDDGGSSTIPMLADGTEYTFEVDQVLDLAGRVLTSEGAPIAGAEIWASWSRFSGPGFVATRTDKAGCYQCRIANTASIDLWSRSPGFPPSAVAHIDPAEGNRELDFEQSSTTARISGRVVNIYGAPVREGARVFAVPTTEEFAIEVATETLPDGRFLFEDLAPGPHAIVAEGPDSASAHCFANAPANEIQLRLEAPATLEGRLHYTGCSYQDLMVGVHTAPIEGSNRIALRRQVRSVTPSEDGSFRIVGARPGAAIGFVMHRRTTILLTEPLDLPPGTSSLWHPTASIDRAVRGVSASKPTGDRAIYALLAFESDAVEDAVVPIRPSKDTGEFTFPGRIGERYFIAVTDDLHHPFRGSWSEATTSSALQVINVCPAGQSATVHGILRETASNCVVQMRHQGIPARLTTIPSNNAFHFENIAPGKYAIDLVHASGATAQIAQCVVIPNARAVKLGPLTAPELGTIHLRDAHAPTDALHARLVPVKGGVPLRLHDPTGQGVSAQCFSGDYHLETVRAGALPSRSLIHVRPSATTIIDLPRIATANHRITFDFDQTKAPVKSKQIHATLSSPNGWSFDFVLPVTRDTPDPVVELGLDAGSYHIGLRTAWHTFAEREFEVAHDSNGEQVTVVAR